MGWSSVGGVTIQEGLGKRLRLWGGVGYWGSVGTVMVQGMVRLMWFRDGVEGHERRKQIDRVLCDG